jgi:hypothetical protein
MKAGNPPASGFSGLCRPRRSRSKFLPISITAAGLFYAASVLAGSWHLIEWTAADAHPLGADAMGRLIYSEDGFMAAFLARADGSSDALAYSGAWEMRGTEVVHSVSVSTRASFVGAELVRAVSWEGDDLVLTTPPTRDGVVNVLRWRREAA